MADDVNIRLKLDKSGFSANMNAAKGELQSFGKMTEEQAQTFRRAGLVMMGAGLVLAAGLWKAAEAAGVQEAANTKLTAALKAGSQYTKDGADELINYAGSLQKTTRFADEMIVSAQGMLATFLLSTDTIKQLTPRLLDLAEGVRKSTGETVALEDIAKAVGKAYTIGLGALKRYGLAVDDATIAQFNQASQMEKTNILTKVMDENYKGLAEAAGKTFAGQVDILKNKLGELAEKLGMAVIPTFSQFFKIIGQALDWLNELSPATADATAKLLGWGSAGLVATGVAMTIIGWLPEVAHGWNLLTSALKAHNLTLASSPALLGLATLASAALAAEATKAGTGFKSVSESMDYMKKGGKDLDGILGTLSKTTEGSTKKTEAQAEATRKAKQMMQDYKEAIDNVTNANQEFEQASINLERAVIRQAEAHKKVNDLQKEGKTDTEEYKNALLDARQSDIDVTRTTEENETKKRADLDTSMAKLNEYINNWIRVNTEKIPQKAAQEIGEKVRLFLTGKIDATMIESYIQTILVNAGVPPAEAAKIAKDTVANLEVDAKDPGGRVSTTFAAGINANAPRATAEAYAMREAVKALLTFSTYSQGWDTGSSFVDGIADALKGGPDRLRPFLGAFDDLLGPASPPGMHNWSLKRGLEVGKAWVEGIQKGIGKSPLKIAGISGEMAGKGGTVIVQNMNVVLPSVTDPQGFAEALKAYIKGVRLEAMA